MNDLSRLGSCQQKVVNTTRHHWCCHLVDKKINIFAVASIVAAHQSGEG